MKKLGAKILSAVLAVTILMSIFAFTVPAVCAVDILPDVIDNSESPYFPAIESQGNLGACGYWA